MTRHTLALLLPIGLAVVASGVAAQQMSSQEVRIVTTDVVGGLPQGMGQGPAQPMGKGTGVLFGQATEADSNRPVSGALVSLSIPGAQPIRVMADAQGRFGFRDLPRGRFSLSATRPGWVDGAYGRTRPGGPTLPLELQEGEKASGVTVPMWRYAAITGLVTEENGDPIVNKPVRVLRRTIVGGKIKLVSGAQDMTDDRGMYRIGMLEPGDYVVAVPMQQNGMGIEIPFEAAGGGTRDVMFVTAARTAVAGAETIVTAGSAFGGGGDGMAEDGRPLAFPTVFYPNVPAASRATVITVASGEERAAVDFQLRAVPTVKVSGTAMGPEGPAANLQITMAPADADDLSTPIENITGFTDGQGRFTIPGVPPGQYVLRAVRTPRVMMGGGETTTIQQGGNVMVMRTISASGPPPLPTDPTLWAEMALSIGARDLSDLTVGLRPGIKMSGTVQFNGAAEKPAADRLSAVVGINLEPADSRPGLTGGRGRVENSGTFATMGVPPGRYFVRVTGAPQGWTFHSAMVNGRDASVVPVEFESSDVSGVVVSFTDRPTEIAGDITVENAAPESISVLVFPSDTNAWTGYGTSSRQFASARVGKDGKFRIPNLPAGDYLAVAIPDSQAADWQNPKVLQDLAGGATRIRVRDGDKISQNLKVIR